MMFNMKPHAIALLSNLAISASLLFIPNLADELGASNTQIGIIGAVYGFAVFTSAYLFGRASDVYGRKFFIQLGLGISSITFLMQILTDPSFIAPFWADPWLLALSRGLAGLSIGMFPAALTAYVYESKNSLGRFTSLASLGWAIGNFIVGLIAMYWGAFVLSSACLLMAFFISFTMPHVAGSRLSVPFFPWRLMKRNWQVYLSYFIRHTGASGIWIIYPLYIVSLGGDKFWVGLIYSVNTLTQFFLMPYIDRFKSKSLISVGLALSSTSFFAFTFAQNFYQLIPMQILLGSSWSCLYVGSLLYLMKYNVEKATCTGILSSLISLARVFGALLGGVLSELFGFEYTMYVAAALTVAGFVLFRISIKDKGM